MPDPTRKPGSGHWAKGVSGNPGGRRAENYFKRLISLELNRAAKNQPPEAKNGRRLTRAESIIRKVCDLAEDGDLRATAFLVERIDGLPKPQKQGDPTPFGDAIKARTAQDNERMQQLGMRYGMSQMAQRPSGDKPN